MGVSGGHKPDSGENPKLGEALATKKGIPWQQNVNQI